MLNIKHGPGDAETWGDCQDHPNDPRAENGYEEDDIEENLEEEEGGHDE